MDVQKHPLIKQAYELCLAIEDCGASLALTHAVKKAVALGDAIDAYIDANTIPAELACTKEDSDLTDVVEGASSEITEDTGKHYRYVYRARVSNLDAKRGYVEVKLDPFRIASIYGLGLPQGTILKKCLAGGMRGHNDLKEDLKDIVCAAQRMIEMVDEG